MPTLLDINQSLVAFQQLLDESTDESGEISPEAEAVLTAWFEELEQDRDAKLNAYGALIREWQLQAACRRAEAEQIDAESKRLKAVAVARENRVKRLKERLMEFMQGQGVKKIETARHKFTVCANGGVQGVVVSVPADELPAAFQHIAITPATETLRAALLRGEQIGGVELQPRGSHLRIS
jgi:hypothetical protein